MKQCPTCNRTYSDNTQSFCLDDGTPLITSYDPEATHIIDPPPRQEPARAAPHEASLTQARAPRTNPALYVAIALLALLVGGGLVALLKSGTKTDPTSQSSKPNSNPTLEESSKSTPSPAVKQPEKIVLESCTISSMSCFLNVTWDGRFRTGNRAVRIKYQGKRNWYLFPGSGPVPLSEFAPGMAEFACPQKENCTTNPIVVEILR